MRPKSKCRGVVIKSLFPKNMIRGSKIMNAFEILRGYSPLIYGIRRERVPKELINAHMDRESIREI